MGKLKAKLDAFRFKGILVILLVFLLISAISSKDNSRERIALLAPNFFNVFTAQKCACLNHGHTVWQFNTL